MDLEEQYDKIYRYCYFKLRHQQKAEDITQETFLRFLENTAYREQGKRLQYLYTIARNLCMDEFRKMTYEQSMGTFPGKKQSLKMTGEGFLRCIARQLIWSET